MSAPLASFDCLELGDSLGDSSDGLTQGEVQVLDYLACLLAVYDGRPSSWWGFGFSVTETGAPFARELSYALSDLVQARWLTRHERTYELTTAGREARGFQRELAPNRPRRRYLTAASSAALSLPLPRLSDALAHEPGLRRALRFLRRKQLLDDMSLALVEEQFQALSDALESGPAEREDLTVPTVVWLTFLSEQADLGIGEAA